MRIRIGLGSCGIAAGAAKIFDTIKDEIAARGLDVDLQQTGCIGMCHHEPLLDVIEDDGTVYTYGHVTPDHAARILDEHICAGHHQGSRHHKRLCCQYPHHRQQSGQKHWLWDQTPSESKFFSLTPSSFFVNKIAQLFIFDWDLCCFLKETNISIKMLR
jgi:(2Fe-2S) ferredoxin